MTGTIIPIQCYIGKQIIATCLTQAHSKADSHCFISFQCWRMPARFFFEAEAQFYCLCGYHVPEDLSLECTKSFAGDKNVLKLKPGERGRFFDYPYMRKLGFAHGQYLCLFVKPSLFLISLINK